MFSVLPFSIRFPLNKINTFSVKYSITSKSCEIINIVVLYFLFISFKRFKIFFLDSSSKAVVGSSIKSKGGFRQIPIAIKTLCLIPPESSCGYFFLFFNSKPTISKTSSNFFCNSFLSENFFLNISKICFSIVKEGFKDSI